MGAVAVPLMIAGTAVSAYSQYRAGQAQKADYKYAADIERYKASIAEYNAQLEERQAQMALERGKFESQKQAREANRTQKRLVAQLGASGAVVSAGAPLEVLGEQRKESTYENLIIGYNSIVESGYYKSRAASERYQANLYRYQGDRYDTAADNAGRAGIWNAFGTGIMGAGTIMSGFNQGTGSQVSQLGSRQSGLLYGQTGFVPKGSSAMSEATKLRY